MEHDIRAFHARADARPVVAVYRIELDTDRDVGELSSQHVVDADDVMPLGEKGVRQVAA